VTFFASWCPPCATEMRGLRDFIKKNGPDKINIIAVNWIEELTGLSPSRLNRFMRVIDPSIKVVSGTKTVSRDFGNVRSIPAAFIYDKNGRQVFALGGGRGGHGRDYLRRKQLERALAKMK